MNYRTGMYHNVHIAVRFFNELVLVGLIRFQLKYRYCSAECSGMSLSISCTLFSEPLRLVDKHARVFGLAPLI